LVWAGPGRNDAALEAFFDQLGDDRAAQLTHITADMADGSPAGPALAGHVKRVSREVVEGTRNPEAGGERRRPSSSVRRCHDS
jgi:transposase